jgi:hypothetical protein
MWTPFEEYHNRFAKNQMRLYLKGIVICIDSLSSF